MIYYYSYKELYSKMCKYLRHTIHFIVRRVYCLKKNNSFDAKTKYNFHTNPNKIQRGRNVMNKKKRNLTMQNDLSNNNS